MTMRKTAFFLLPPQRDAPKAMCEEWQPYSCGILPPSLGRRCPEGAEVGSQRNEKKWEETFPRFVIPSAAEGSFSLAVRRRVFDSRKRETPYRGKAEAVLPLKGLAKGRGKRGRKRFLAFARNDDAKNGILPPSLGRRCPEGAEIGSQRNEKKCEICLSPFRHPERSRGIFFVSRFRFPS